MSFECDRCFGPLPADAVVCDHCGALYSAQPGAPRRTRKAQERDRDEAGRYLPGLRQPERLEEVDEVELERLPTGNPALDLVTGGGFVRGRSYALKGPGGTGKSRVALAAAAALCKLGPVVYACASAEEAKQDVRRYAAAAGYLERRPVRERLHVLDQAESPDALIDAIASVEPVFVVVDAVSALEELQYAARLLREYGRAADATVLGLHHERADGVMVGGLKLPYLVDAILETDGVVKEFGAWRPTDEPGSHVRLRSGKNRYSAQGSRAILKLTDRGFDVVELHDPSKEVAA